MTSIEQERSRVADILHDLMVKASVVKLSQYSKISEITLGKAQNLRKVFGHWLSLVMISSKEITIAFKVHFMSSSARVLAGSSVGADPNDVPVSEANDFMQEYCNLVAGTVKNCLSEQGVQLGISLPFLVRGFEELFFPIEDPRITFEKKWEVRGANFGFICTSVTEIHSPVRIVSVESKHLSGAGGVEFL